MTSKAKSPAEDLAPELDDEQEEAFQALLAQKQKATHARAEKARGERHAELKPLGDALDKLGNEALLATLRDARKAVAYDTDLAIPVERIIEAVTVFVVPIQKRIAALAEPLPEPTSDGAD